MPLTPAEKQAAYRARLAARTSPVDIPGLDSPQDESQSAVEIEPGRTPSVTLEAYVQQIRNEALEYSKQIGETNEATPIPGTKEFVVNRRKDRLKRAERYARWRYAGFLEGTVASL